MIVPMSKVSLVVLDSRRRSALERLRGLGVMHVQPGAGSSRSLEENLEAAGLLGKALALLPAAEAAGAAAAELDRPAALEEAGRLVRLGDELRQAREERDRLARERERLAAWGRFKLSSLEALEAAGLLFRLYEVPAEKYKTFSCAAARFTIFKTKRTMGIACAARRPEDLPAGFEPLARPALDLDGLDSAIAAKDARLAGLGGAIEASAGLAASFAVVLRGLEAAIEFERVSAGMGVDGPVSHLSGYVPAPKLEGLRAAAAEAGWGLLVRQPEADEPVPTLLANPPWIRIIQPVYEFLGIMPGYRERDISLFFLLYFAVFFAMIIGDAGYGLVFFGSMLFIWGKEKKKTGRVSDGTLLITVMSLGTVVWGALTGTWFGSEALSKIEPLRSLVVPALYGFDPASSELVKLITFIIGITHLVLAHVWNFLREIRQKPRIRALAQLGWLAMLAGVFYLVLNLVLSRDKYPLPPFAVYLALGGLLAVLVFGQQEGDFVKGVLKGLGGFINTTLSGISCFSDIISYIRLFAVGLAGVEISKSFYGMTAGLFSAGIAGVIAGVIIMLVAHALNMAMAALAVIVHGMRLNLLEFSSHLGQEWVGQAYRPFAERQDAR